MKGFILYRTNEETNEKEHIFLYGRLENGKSFVSSHLFKPYFFIKEKNKEILKKIDGGKEIFIEKTDLKNFKNQNVIKLNFKNQKHLKEILRELNEYEIETFEGDIKPHMRFMMDQDILDCIEIQGDFESNERVDCYYREPVIKPCEGNFDLEILSIDIETSKKDNKLFCVGLYSKKIQEVLMITKDNIKGVISCEDERDCLEKLKERIIEIDPDVIVGWNVIDFDLVFLKRLFDENKISFDMGRNNKNPRFRIEKDFLKKSSIDVPGRIVLDGLNLIRDPFIKEAPSIKNLRFESYALEEVSQQILGESKLIKGKERHNEIENLYLKDEKSRKKLAEYNLQDCKLVYDVIKKTDIIQLSMERSRLTGMPLDKLTGSIANFDSLYIREARNRGFVSPTVFFKKKSQKITGGFVISPQTGIYKNVLVLDFKSLYPSIIRTFNIDPSSQIKNKEKDCIESPNGAFFKNQAGILPDIIQKLSEAREKAKKEKRELSSYAIKIIMNSFFGVLASPNSRYFNMDLGNSITNFGQEIIKLTARKIEEKGYEVIYGDTDSIFLSTKLNKKNAMDLGKSLPEEINNFYKKYIKENHHRISYLELEFDKLFLSLLIPRTRNQEEGSGAGAKKRYAGLIEKNNQKEIAITGLEAIRGDWTEAAQEFQKGLLFRLFNEEDIVKYIRSFILDLRNGKLNDNLVYRKSIRKDLSEYTKITPPHVKAARKLKSLESNRIEYYITKEGPEPIQNLKNPIDYEHYIEKQIKPIAKTILDTLKLNMDLAFSDSVQKKLF